MGVYDQIVLAKRENRKLLAVLLDPDKLVLESIEDLLGSIHEQEIDFLLVGGSEVEDGQTEKVVTTIKKYSSVPVILFPGDYSQLTRKADALLFLSLISGRNPEYLIDQQVKAVPIVSETNLEVIPTAYMLIDGGAETSVERVSGTQPMPLNNEKQIINTAIAGMYMGNKLIYLEAGSGAKNPVPSSLVSEIAQKTDIPIIVGGGIRSHEQLVDAYSHGADLVVIGTAFETNPKLLGQIIKNEHFY